MVLDDYSYLGVVVTWHCYMGDKNCIVAANIEAGRRIVALERTESREELKYNLNVKFWFIKTTFR
jgi:hypothetical protein